MGSRWIIVILDEGGIGLTTVGNVTYARPRVAEKGYVDAESILHVGGGHSSRLPVRSGIGIMAEIVVALENHSCLPVLAAHNLFEDISSARLSSLPRRSNLDCDGHWSMTPTAWTMGVDSEERGPETRFSMRTSQAVDIIVVVTKTTPFRNSISTIVNYRLALQKSLESVKTKVAKLLQSIADKHNLKLDMCNGNIKDNKARTLMMQPLSHRLWHFPISLHRPASINDFAGTLPYRL